MCWISGFIDETGFVPGDFALTSLSDSLEQEIEQTLKSKQFPLFCCMFGFATGCNFSSEWIKALFFLFPNKHQTVTHKCCLFWAFFPFATAVCLALPVTNRGINRKIKTTMSAQTRTKQYVKDQNAERRENSCCCRMQTQEVPVCFIAAGPGLYFSFVSRNPFRAWMVHEER